MKPPRNAVDAAPVYILPYDTAWDTDRIEREKAEAPDEEHPTETYFNGDTRFDLYAGLSYRGQPTSAVEYLLEGDPPVKFTLRRLTVQQIAELRDLINRAYRDSEEPQLNAVWTLCAKYGLADIEGLPYASSGGKATDATLTGIFDAVGGLGAVALIGLATWRVSQPLTDPEKKV